MSIGWVSKDPFLRTEQWNARKEIKLIHQQRFSAEIEKALNQKTEPFGLAKTARKRHHKGPLAGGWCRQQRKTVSRRLRDDRTPLRGLRQRSSEADAEERVSCEAQAAGGLASRVSCRTDLGVQRMRFSDWDNWRPGRIPNKKHNGRGIGPWGWACLCVERLLRLFFLFLLCVSSDYLFLCFDSPVDKNSNYCDATTRSGPWSKGGKNRVAVRRVVWWRAWVAAPAMQRKHAGVVYVVGMRAAGRCDQRRE
ncbi:hypothetical protein F5Y18DRAFT_24381 [Xylariaceae sp. FL1019]|nr:hypothetical protein F5Y18DRAFT_24381 [Xylariaceae sp. FL1019]